MPTGNQRILFVDDESVLVELGQQSLEMLGYAPKLKSAIKLFV